jgi:L-alanine-DL-glutamate epimerase-like enolase superfamily enzyme
MHKWLKVSVVMAVLLACAGAFYSFTFVLPGIETAALSSMSSPAQRSGAVEDCLEAAQMVFAVHWAVACMNEAGQATAGAADGNAECDLPNSKAAVVNAWLDEAERACFTEARGGLGH